MLRSTAAAVILATIFGSSAQAKPACVNPGEARSLQFRQLQIELMVATLRCRSVDPSFRENYTNYVTKAGPALQRNAGELRTMFARHGQNVSQLDRLMTELSNEASMRSLYAENYCQAQAERLAHVVSMPPQDLEAFAAQNIEAPAPLCAGPKTREVKATPIKSGTKTPGTGG